MASKPNSDDVVVLAGDVGGTNINLALIGKHGSRFIIVFDRHYKTREEKSLVEPILRFLQEARALHPSLKPERCCISGAGPVVDNRIMLTNAPWGIDGNSLGDTLGIPVLLINDFMAISYGVLLLDHTDPAQITRLKHTDGRLPEPRNGVRAIVGAGTGLGVGFVAGIRDISEAFPSEGGHITLPCYDDETRAFQAFLEAKFGFTPGAEAGVSGQGIANLFSFFTASDSNLGDCVREILARPELEWPALVASYAQSDPLCSRIMDVFVKLYARVCADMCATFLPSGGIYLAGGIVSKNESWFTEKDRFMAMFEKSYARHIRDILGVTPVFIVKDYSVSLYGAANAAVTLS